MKNNFNKGPLLMVFFLQSVLAFIELTINFIGVESLIGEYLEILSKSKYLTKVNDCGLNK